MDVPDDVKKLRQDVIDKNGIRHDDIEFTFSKGRWSHLGEATLMNRVKSHPDVGERWVRIIHFAADVSVLSIFADRKQYPTLLAKIREDEARMNQTVEAS